MRVALLLALGCRPKAELVDWCVTEGECPACEGDEDCVLTGNPCTDTVYCAHVDAEIAVVQVGCSAAAERRWPPPEACGCDAGTCRGSP